MEKEEKEPESFHSRGDWDDILSKENSRGSNSYEEFLDVSESEAEGGLQGATLAAGVNNRRMVHPAVSSSDWTMMSNHAGEEEMTELILDPEDVHMLTYKKKSSTKVPEQTFLDWVDTLDVFDQMDVWEMMGFRPKPIVLTLRHEKGVSYLLTDEKRYCEYRYRLTCRDPGLPGP